MYKTNLVGEVFHNLTVIRRVGTTSARVIIWKCVCVCNNICNVRSNNLRTGHTKSCGCIKKDTAYKEARKAEVVPNKKQKCILCGKIKWVKEFRKSAEGWQSKCKVCMLSNERTKKNKIKKIYQNQIRNAKHRKDPIPTYTKQELVDWCMTQPIYHKLYKAWEQSGFKRKQAPSCDRINDYTSYTLDNLQLTTWEFNEHRSHIEVKCGINNKRSKAVIQLSIKRNKPIQSFVSAAYAARTIPHTTQSNISQCCNGSRNTCGGYKWKFA